MLTVSEIVAAIKNTPTSAIKKEVMLCQPIIDKAKKGNMTLKTQHFLSIYITNKAQ